MPIKRSKAVLAAKGVAALAAAAKTVMNRRAGAKGGARTTTLLKRKTRSITLKPGGATTSVFGHKSPCPKYMAQVFKQNMPQTYVANGSLRATAACGLQVAVHAASVVGGNTAGNFTQGDTGAILTQYYGATATGAQKTSRIYFQRSLQQYMFTNNQTNNIFVDIYDVVARRDGEYNPVAAGDQGLADQGISGGLGTINITPTQSQLFNQNWKVLKRTNIELGPGVSHRHIQSIALNKAWNAERMQTGSAYYAGLSTGVLVVAWGAPCHDATTVTNVSTASVLLDIVFTRQITYTVCTPQVTASKYVSALPTIVTEREVNEESGLPATVSS